MAAPTLPTEALCNGEDAPNGSSPSALSKIKLKTNQVYSRTPILKNVPRRAIVIILLLVFVNVAVWASMGIVLHYHSGLSGTAILAYTFGLRHALDADHISAIDLMTRRLVATGQRPVTVGTWFSLGHSTIVIVTSIVVAATASAISQRFNTFSKIGGIIGSSVSAAFLMILGAANAYILYILIRQMRRILRRRRQLNDDPSATAHQDTTIEWKIEGAGFFFRIFKKLFWLIDRPWKMYPLGVLFGLGFDTSSEVALLGISSIQAAHGTSLWLILIFPILFTAGMCLIDTIDGALMLALYTSTQLARDPIAVLYYNVALTCITVVVAVVIGIIQLLELVVAVVGGEKLNHRGSAASRHFWKGVQEVGKRYDVVGACICALFVVVGVGSVVLYRPWRKRIDAKYPPPPPPLPSDRSAGLDNASNGSHGPNENVECITLLDTKRSDKSGVIEVQQDLSTAVDSHDT